MMTVYLKAVSIIALGIDNWEMAKDIFSNKTNYAHVKVGKKLPTMLSANESRRCSRTIQLALNSVLQLTEKTPFNSEDTNYVFTSCNGDLSVFHHISTALSQQGRPVSPTKFHNSVHNAPAGYASIGLKSKSPSTSICAYKDSFSAGLLEAFVQCITDNTQCLLCGYDEIPPEPLLSLFPIDDDFAYSLLLSAYSEPATAIENSINICRLDIELSHDKIVSKMPTEQFETLRKSNPQAQILPLLHAIANKQETQLVFSNNEQQILLQLSEFN